MPRNISENGSDGEKSNERGCEHKPTVHMYVGLYKNSDCIKLERTLWWRTKLIKREKRMKCKNGNVKKDKQEVSAQSYLTSCSRRSQSACRCPAPRRWAWCGCNGPESVWAGRSGPRLSGCGSPGRSEDKEKNALSDPVTDSPVGAIRYSDTTTPATNLLLRLQHFHVLGLHMTTVQWCAQGPPVAQLLKNAR